MGIFREMAHVSNFISAWFYDLPTCSTTHFRSRLLLIRRSRVSNGEEEPRRASNTQVRVLESSRIGIERSVMQGQAIPFSRLIGCKMIFSRTDLLIFAQLNYNPFVSIYHHWCVQIWISSFTRNQIWIKMIATNRIVQGNNVCSLAYYIASVSDSKFLVFCVLKREVSDLFCPR